MKKRNLTFKLSLILILAILGSSFSPALGVMASPAASNPGQDINSRRIEFDPGATSAEVSGSISKRATVQYKLSALAHQLMNVDLSANNAAILTVRAANGDELEGLTSSSTSFRGYLPVTGDYILEVTAGRRDITYTLNVMIPERISFKRGTTSAAVDGELEAYQGHDYILRARKGQLMEVVATPGNPNRDLQLVIYGVDGTVLRSGMGEGSSFRGLLPLTEDYIVSVRAGARSVSYSMNVIIPRRISFEPGAISAVTPGKISAYQSQYYVLRAMKNQTMRVKVMSEMDVQLIIYGADGTVLRSGMGEGATWVGKLPSTQDYIVVVRAAEDPAEYRLRVTIR